MVEKDKQHKVMLERIARQAMTERGLLPDFSAGALAELAGIQSQGNPGGSRDLRGLLWCSIDNDASRDLDQLTVAEALSDGLTRILVAVADVEAMVTKDSAIDAHALHNTTSVYTAAVIFPMLPERLSTDLSSLNFNQDRLALIMEMVIDTEGALQQSDIFTGLVCNKAKLAYNSVAAWLGGTGPVPEAVAAVQGLGDNLRLQDRAAQGMIKFRQTHGALNFETIEARAVFEGDEIKALEVEKKNRAKTLIEDFMIGANGVTARYLASKKYPSLRRVVRTPKRWERIVEIAGEHGFNLPAEPDSQALEAFLMKARESDPLRFPDLSLSIIKLMGAGEYVAELPGDPTPPGHFGLAVRDYSHSTAPNRRFPDLITQRLLKAALAGKPAPYGAEELEALAKHCTQGEDAARKVERQVEKSAAAVLLSSRIGERFEGLVTGAAPKGTWVRLLHPPVEGRLTRGFEGVDVGQRIRVQLIHTDVERGFIDFKKV
ncbi:MAG TPA: RNB domain-containing ribonuclease [Thermodesulfobacteriota bacterium]|nr:RNB domain-containing ribonuclease [Thermodesulfobacteriota bacterium]